MKTKIPFLQGATTAKLFKCLREDLAMFLAGTPPDRDNIDASLDVVVELQRRFKEEGK